MIFVAQVALLAGVWTVVSCTHVASSLPPGDYGVDFAYDPCSVDCFKCLLSKGYTYFISGIYHPEQQYIPGENASTVNYMGFTNIRNAYIAGFKEVHAYYYPCTEYAKYRCPNVTAQVNLIVDYMEGLFTPFYNPSFWWIDVEVPEHWSKNTGYNVGNFTQIINAFMNRGIYTVSMGVYTSSYAWDKIMGGNSMSSYPLWWANPNGRPDSPFSPFAGWQQPAIHQYRWGKVHDLLFNECRIKADRNWRRTLPQCDYNRAANVRCTCGTNPDNVCNVGQYCDGSSCFGTCQISDTKWLTYECWCGDEICGYGDHYNWLCVTGNRCVPLPVCPQGGIVTCQCTCGSTTCSAGSCCGSCQSDTNPIRLKEARCYCPCPSRKSSALAADECPCE